MSAPPHVHDDLLEHLERWVGEELITRNEADAIARFEHRAEPSARRIPLVTEAIGYVGAALLVAAGSALAARFWDELPGAGRLAVLATVTVLLLGLGFAFRGSAEPAFGRLAGVLWLGGTVAAGGTAATAGVIVADLDGREAAIAAGLGAIAVAVPLYAIRRAALQHLALFGAGTLAVGSIFGIPDSVAPGVAVWAFGATWTAAGQTGRLPPTRAASALGSLTALIAALTIAATADAGLWLGLATAAALLAASVLRHDRVLLGFGVVGLFVFVLDTVARYLGGGAGMAIGLAGAGLAVLAAALLLARRGARGDRSA